uniref:Arf-GAP with GTPase, ANK repeat and PH domain-containing protein 1-like n=1 Tax=Callorhinchus milii TaxID=7868 RepID=A0A4W3H920_CALMI
EFPVTHTVTELLLCVCVADSLHSGTLDSVAEQAVSDTKSEGKLSTCPSVGSSDQWSETSSRTEGNGAGDGVSSPSSGRLELPASPQINRKKHRRKKSVSKADSMMGLAEGNPPSPAHWDPAL